MCTYPKFTIYTVYTIFIKHLHRTYTYTFPGKLCILDYGLMTSIDENRRLGLLEYVAHLLAKVYALFCVCIEL